MRIHVISVFIKSLKKKIYSQYLKTLTRLDLSISIAYAWTKHIINILFTCIPTKNIVLEYDLEMKYADQKQTTI